MIKLNRNIDSQPGIYRQLIDLIHKMTVPTPSLKLSCKDVIDGLLKIDADEFFPNNLSKIDLLKCPGQNTFYKNYIDYHLANGILK